MAIFLLGIMIRLIDMVWLTGSFYAVLVPTFPIFIKCFGLASLCLKAIDVILEFKKNDTNKYT